MDYILDFHNDLTDWIYSEFNEFNHVYWQGVDITRAIINFEWYNYLQLRNDYIAWRKNGKNCPFSSNRILLTKDDDKHLLYVNDDLQNHPWKSYIESIGRSSLIYADSYRRLMYLAPILNNAEKPYIVLTRDTKIPSNIYPNKNLKFMLLPFVKTKACVSSKLWKISPLLAEYVHSIYCLISWLKPTEIICCDGCQTQYQLAAIVGKSFGIDSTCYQFGWPGFIHVGFRNLPYTKFVTWGKKYTSLLAPYNNGVKFLSTKRLGKTNSFGSHDCISFFLQAPVFVSSELYLSKFISVIGHVAQKYPNIHIIIRQHHEYFIDRLLSKITYTANVEVDYNSEIEEIYTRTSIAISQFSSCLVESELFGCYAICFNLTEGYIYDALPEKQRARSEEELLEKIQAFLTK